MEINSLFSFRQVYRNRWNYFGGYTHCFIMGDGEEMCIPCVEGQLRNLISAFSEGADLAWKPVGYEAIEDHDHEENVYCSQCHKVLFDAAEGLE
ncbi:MAG: hypothetical protein M3P98_04215 [bacterium]|nr:hypothetical protein [bacterium]